MNETGLSLINIKRTSLETTIESSTCPHSAYCLFHNLSGNSWYLTWVNLLNNTLNLALPQHHFSFNLFKVETTQFPMPLIFYDWYLSDSLTAHFPHLIPNNLSLLRLSYLYSSHSSKSYFLRVCIPS